MSHHHHETPGTGAAHSGHADMIAEFRQRFWISLALTVPVVLLSPMIQHLLGIDGLRFSGYRFVLLGFASVIFFYGGACSSNPAKKCRPTASWSRADLL